MKETIVKINKTKSWFFKKNQRRSLIQTHQEERRNQINKIRNEKGEVLIDNVEIQMIIRVL